MKIAVDTSVALAAFAPWHEAHTVALSAVRDAYLPAHCGIETFSTLTRLPEPFRAPGPVVAEYLRRRFEDRWLFPANSEVVDLPRTLAQSGIVGGASYDALIALTARSNDASLKTIDERAVRTYLELGIDFEILR